MQHDPNERYIITHFLGELIKYNEISETRYELFTADYVKIVKEYQSVIEKYEKAESKDDIHDLWRQIQNLRDEVTKQRNERLRSFDELQVYDELLTKLIDFAKLYFVPPTDLG